MLVTPALLSFARDMVPQEVLDQIIEAGLYADSGGYFYSVNARYILTSSAARLRSVMSLAEKPSMLMRGPKKPLNLGEYRGFPMQLHCDGSKFKVTMKQNLTYTAELADDPVGNVTRIDNALEGMEEKRKQHETRLVRPEAELKNAQEEAERPFPKEDELRQKSARLTQLNQELENPRTKAVGQTQDDEEPDSEDGGAPVQAPPTPPIPGGGKPSIRQTLRDYAPPAPVVTGTDLGRRRKAAL